MKPQALPLCLLLAALAGCSSPDVEQMPVQVLSADAGQGQMTEVLPVEQVLRPQDVLDVIFHIGSTSQTRYRVQPGDQVDVSFLSAAELGGNKLVLPDGSIEMPYVGNVQVAGLTAEEARRTLESAYARVLKKPQVTFSISHAMAQLDNLRTSLTNPATGLSREITVGSDGRASFPLLGAMSLQGMTLSQLQKTINQRYAKEVGQVSADVLLKSTAANEVFVLGEVGQPGAYPIRRPVSVLEALTLAKGAGPTARLDSVVIMRRTGNQVQARTYDVAAALDRNAAQFAYLQPDDLLYVPKTRLAKAGAFSKQLADIIMFQGVGFSFGYRVDNKESDNN
ncbi:MULTISPECIES: polysaccharide biosynthesis/export family protein [Pseudomonas]|jgi:polysaccharide export outer membrane protein|uniref:Polysaccharide biosynthesis protein n=3 Tax=Pseudomonas chlororaphis TaxID=587753 RepID=A0AAD0ZJ04_9PSED|nr:MULTISPECIES: polysaccharide biosynthesis/export family protein [Pseudomonas]AIC20021.1 polysaccharide biosynthesis protein [Pseudomonas chlororaphis]AZD35840.1 putative polysaccharide biosynthesis protein [Pseudomonas chlororaphis subsp. aurantiaca]AZD42177.1 putative polysaccharide biosynthesis protein [Pseudomonas chlororaphis subsp. aurantiaca]AZD48400.1 putative polysaccharide biosynthesis protein [Pseudomonas chlororaphis subsp. aurantiaca]AZD54801.1 putative polysaccharide biosynthes